MIPCRDSGLWRSARWANTHKEAIEAVEVIAHLVAIDRALSALDPAQSPDADAH